MDGPRARQDSTQGHPAQGLLPGPREHDDLSVQDNICNVHESESLEKSRLSVIYYCRRNCVPCFTCYP